MLAKASLKDGIADFTVTKLAPGTHLVIAEYSGDCEHPPANSPLFTAGRQVALLGSGVLFEAIRAKVQLL